eukprot:CCRYP_014103-RA/>CCRYP_014103-RA protein AED:0.42 eAED:0.47 QI:0/0/0/1/0/0/2/0/132
MGQCIAYYTQKMQRPNRAMMLLGKGAVGSFSRKQKLKVRSLCNGVLVRINDAMSWMICCKSLIEAQAYSIEQNGWSGSKRTVQIKSRYFFVKDRIEHGDLEIQHMPTDKMWSNILVKPKQGKARFLEKQEEC